MDPTPQLVQLLIERTARVRVGGGGGKEQECVWKPWRWKRKGQRRLCKLQLVVSKELVRRHCSNIELTDILRMNPFMLLISLPTNSFMKHMYSSFTPNLRESSERHGKRGREGKESKREGEEGENEEGGGSGKERKSNSYPLLPWCAASPCEVG